MTPLPVTFYVYADNEAQVQRLQDALYNFVRLKANRGIPITAERLTSALECFGGNPLIDNYFN